MAAKKDTVLKVLAIVCVILFILMLSINGKRRFEAQKSMTLEIELEEVLEARLSLEEELKNLEAELEEALGSNESLKKELEQLRLEKRSLEGSPKKESPSATPVE